MLIKIEGLTFNLVVDKPKNLKNKTPIIFLHGFMGSLLDWEKVRKSISGKSCFVIPDLIGHGKTSKPPQKIFYNTQAIVMQINSIVKKLKIKKFVLVGYSMGGRLAIAYSLKYPKNILGLILESSTFGIENLEERRKRRKDDFILSKKIKNIGIKNFLKEWYKNPMFSKINNLKDVLKQREIKNRVGYQNILREFSQGKMPNYWKQVKKISFPLLLITGANDKKFTKINRQIKKSIPNSQHIIVKNTGHNVHLEKPLLFANFVKKFLKQI